MKDNAVAAAQALDVCCQVETNGSMADGVHGLSVKEVMRPSCGQKKTEQATVSFNCNT